MPSACEVDVAGVISMYALLLASGNIPGFLDWNNNYGTEKDKCVCTHCSNFPKSFMEVGDLSSSLMKFRMELNDGIKKSKIE